MNVAYIPVRGGSKSIPLKNIKIIHGKPLVYWVVKAACLCRFIDKVYVATDSSEISTVVNSFKIGIEKTVFEKLIVVGRSAESCTDQASTEFGLLEFATDYDFENIVLIQATSPLLTSEDLDGGFELFANEGVDSVLSVVENLRFFWNRDKNGDAYATNYDIDNRPRRQDFNGTLMENGAFYITSKKALLQSRNRMSGKIKAYEMCQESAYEIDEPMDWGIVETMLKSKTAPTVSPQIKMFLTDCDGCLTDAGMYYSENGDELKKFNTRDGVAFDMLHKRGIITGIVTSESVELNRRRAKKLKLNIIIDGCKNKLEAVKALSEEHQIPLENIAYIGDDINDIEVLQAVGLACCPKDATEKVRNTSHYIANAKGGEGVIREVVEKFIEIGV